MDESTFLPKDCIILDTYFIRLIKKFFRNIAISLFDTGIFVYLVWIFSPWAWAGAAILLIAYLSLLNSYRDVKFVYNFLALVMHNYYYDRQAMIEEKKDIKEIKEGNARFCYMFKELDKAWQSEDQPVNNHLDEIRTYIKNYMQPNVKE
jgi:hypothetical protein